MPGGSICVYDFTCKCDGVPLDAVKKFLKTIAKGWIFQQEKGTLAGYLHWQGRVSLKVAGTLPAVLSKFNQAWGNGFGRLSPTSKDVAKEMTKGDAFYCIKDDTRVDGPWSDKSEPPTPFKSKEIEIVERCGLKPWQETIKEQILMGYDSRSINVVYCPDGNIGKSTFTEWLEYSHIAYEIPMMRLMEDIMNCAMSVQRNRFWNAFTIDMPRAMKKEKLFDFYSGIECLKNGVAYDKRYNWDKMRFNRPHIWIFTNTEPDRELMSRDRWKIWKVWQNRLCILTTN